MSDKRKSRKEQFDAISLIDSLAAREESFAERKFLAAASGGAQVRVRIGNVACRIKIAPSDFEGFGIFQPISYTEAMLVRKASLTERRRYLDLFPTVRLIAVQRVRNGWLAASAHRGDSRFRLDGMVPVLLGSDFNRFDIVECRFDGGAFWFDQVYMRANLQHAEFLRTSLDSKVHPEELAMSGLSPEQRAVYQLAYWNLVDPTGRKRRGTGSTMPSDSQSADPNETRLRESLSHAGAKLQTYTEIGDAFQVTYFINERSFTSAVNKSDLGLVSSGVCLDGHDAAFDLTSLVGVMRQGMNLGEF